MSEEEYPAWYAAAFLEPEYDPDKDIRPPRQRATVRASPRQPAKQEERRLLRVAFGLFVLWLAIWTIVLMGAVLEVIGELIMRLGQAMQSLRSKI